MRRCHLRSEEKTKQPPNRQSAASEDEERKQSVVTTLSLSDEAIALRREDGWDECFVISPPVSGLTMVTTSCYEPLP